MLPPPELTRLRLQVHHPEPDSGSTVSTLTVSFLVNTQQMLLEDFEAACIDAALKHAHVAGHLPVGPMFVRTEEATVPEQKSLAEGGRMLNSLEDMAIDNAIRQGDLVQVICSVDLGLSL